MKLQARFLDPVELEGLPFARCGHNVLIDDTVRIVGFGNITIANNVRIDAHVLIIASGPIEIGSYVHISANCYLEGRGAIDIGDFANLSSYVSLHSVSDDFSGRSLTNPMVPEHLKTLDQGKIVIGRHAVLGTKSTVLPGVRIGEGGILGAHSMAKADIAAWTINAGVPAKPIGERSRDLLALERMMLGKE
jgi:dTDP-4-amino-4,6-dideoxy-D-glucose acyltransferase